MDKDVSVVIPSYNRADLIPATLDSILGQTHTPKEVIVVDDGSTDDTEEAVARFGSRVRYHRVDNGGAPRARNVGASYATSGYLAFCDSDDLWRKDKLERQLELHEQNPNINFSFTNFSFVVDDVWSERTKLDDAPAGFLQAEGTEKGGFFWYDHSLYEQLLQFQPVWPSTMMLSRSYFQRVGGFLEKLGRNPSEDFEFTLRCVQTPPIGVILDPVVGVRRHLANISGDNDKNTRGQVEILEYALEHHSISPETRALVLEQIRLRRIEASHGSFRRGEFKQYIDLVSGVPARAQDWKTRLKRQVAMLPRPLALTMQKFLVKR